MIGLEDRQALAREIDVAHAAGARLKLACATAGIEIRTLQRWKLGAGLVSGDGRPQAVRAVPGHALSEAERARVLAVANEPRFAAVPPARIVPMLADEGIYLASESTFSRMLREHGQTAHRGRAKAPKAVRPPTTHIATEARQVWCWDMTYLPAQVMGRWFHLYLILDLYAARSSAGRRTTATTPTMQRIWCAAPHWPRVLPRWEPSPCCTATTAPRSRPRRCWRCSTGWASNPLTPGHA